MKSLNCALALLEAYSKCNPQYRNWREMYVKGFCLDPKNIDQVKMLYLQYQTIDNSAVAIGE
jgi:hypothetical protein